MRGQLPKQAKVSMMWVVVDIKNTYSQEWSFMGYAHRLPFPKKLAVQIVVEQSAGHMTANTHSVKL